MTKALVCVVCTDELTSTTEAWCGQCGKSYHLNQRVDLPGKDCGQVWINEEHLALEFACDLCLNPPPPDLDEILDLEEAARETGMTPADLQAAADRGGVRHRKTGSGTYLFVRKDLQTLSR
jgi:hypothetical protein